MLAINFSFFFFSMLWLIQFIFIFPEKIFTKLAPQVSFARPCCLSSSSLWLDKLIHSVLFISSKELILFFIHVPFFLLFCRNSFISVLYAKIRNHLPVPIPTLSQSATFRSNPICSLSPDPLLLKNYVYLPVLFLLLLGRINPISSIRCCVSFRGQQSLGIFVLGTEYGSIEKNKD